MVVGKKPGLRGVGFEGGVPHVEPISM
jgi:hypothetical protein